MARILRHFGDSGQESKVFPHQSNCLVPKQEMLWAFLIAVLIIVVLINMVLSAFIGLFMRVANRENYVDAVNTPKYLNCKIDKKLVKEGLAYFKTQRLIICGLVRDSVDTLALIRKKAKLLGKLFSDYIILVV